MIDKIDKLAADVKRESEQREKHAAVYVDVAKLPVGSQKPFRVPEERLHFFGRVYSVKAEGLGQFGAQSQMSAARTSNLSDGQTFTGKLFTEHTYENHSSEAATINTSLCSVGLLYRRGILKTDWSRESI